jgi:NOL1/NOP2/fmu family ribosome biogenesis protein
LPSFADRTSEALSYLREEFGVEALPGRVLEKGDSLWLTTAEVVPEGVPVHALGVRLLRRQERGLKPTSLGLMALGDLVRKKRVELSRDELRALLLGRILTREGLPSGYVALCLDGEVLGCGHVKEGRLRCQIPRGRKQELLIALEAEARGGV